MINKIYKYKIPYLPDDVGIVKGGSNEVKNLLDIIKKFIPIKRSTGIYKQDLSSLKKVVDKNGGYLAFWNNVIVPILKEVAPTKARAKPEKFYEEAMNNKGKKISQVKHPLILSSSIESKIRNSRSFKDLRNNKNYTYREKNIPYGLSNNKGKLSQWIHNNFGKVNVDQIVDQITSSENIDFPKLVKVSTSLKNPYIEGEEEENFTFYTILSNLDKEVSDEDIENMFPLSDEDVVQHLTFPDVLHNHNTESYLFNLLMRLQNKNPNKVEVIKDMDVVSNVAEKLSRFDKNGIYKYTEKSGLKKTTPYQYLNGMVKRSINKKSNFIDRLENPDRESIKRPNVQDNDNAIISRKAFKNSYIPRKKGTFTDAGKLELDKLLTTSKIEGLNIKQRRDLVQSIFNTIENKDASQYISGRIASAITDPNKYKSPLYFQYDENIGELVKRKTVGGSSPLQDQSKVQSGFIFEHILPMGLLLDLLRKLVISFKKENNINLDEDLPKEMLQNIIDIATKFVEDHYKLAYVHPEEDSYLRRFGLRDTIPTKYDIEDYIGQYSRYLKNGLDNSEMKTIEKNISDFVKSRYKEVEIDLVPFTDIFPDVNSKIELDVPIKHFRNSLSESKTPKLTNMLFGYYG